MNPARASAPAFARHMVPAGIAALPIGLSVASPFIEREDLSATIAIGVWLSTTAVVGAVIAARRAGNAVGWMLLAIGALGAIADFGSTYAKVTLATEGLTAAVKIAGWLGHWLWLPALMLFAVLLLIFPTGRLPSSRWRPVGWIAAIGIAVGSAATAFAPGPIEIVPGLDNPVGLTAASGLTAALKSIAPLFELGLALAGITAVASRFRRSTGAERAQIAWLMYAAGLLIVALVFASLASGPVNELSFYLAIAGLLGIPISIGIAMLRHRLYDIDVVINRTIVYVALTTCVVAFYILLVGAMGALFQQRVSLIPALVATGVVAIAFQPLRSALQSIVDRMMYADRKDPYAALADLGRSLEAAYSPEEVLPAIVETVSRSLKVPYVSIELLRDDVYRSAASIGDPTPSSVELPLVHQGATVGRLVVGERRGDELSRADHALLEDLARQGGMAARAVQLTEDLRRSREQLLATREEERRRIRRDLHDGLGPELAGIAMGVGAARNNLSTDLAKSSEQLMKLETQVKEATRLVRDLVEGLRPPALDEFGLVGAIRQKARALNDGTGDLVIDVSGPEPVPELPAAVEVAALRIALEAMTNAARHSGARRCDIVIEIDDDLMVEITDDGGGISATSPRGVGLTSMRERANELGGSLDVASQNGTRITARLPLRTP